MPPAVRGEDCRAVQEVATLGLLESSRFAFRLLPAAKRGGSHARMTNTQQHEPKTFGALVGDARAAKRFSVEQLARRVGKSSTQVRRWETERDPPPGDESILFIAKALDISPAELLTAALAVRDHVRIPCVDAVDKRLVAAFITWATHAREVDKDALVKMLETGAVAKAAAAGTLKPKAAVR